jgi:fructose-specific phosphotransferase system IIA component
MALIDLISPEVVKVPLVSVRKDEVVKELIQILLDAGRISDFDKVREAIMARESLASTGLANGIAVPHAKTDAVKRLTMAMGISPAGVDFDALDNQPSQLFFLLLAPPDQSGPHIEALAEIARITRSRAIYEAFIKAASASEVVDIFREE